MTNGRFNHAVRSEQWRYIRYANHGEELYDHTNDPYEWTNLARMNEHDLLIATLSTDFQPPSISEDAIVLNCISAHLRRPDDLQRIGL